MKTMQFIYQETQIHFLFNSSEENVMINATEMAKLFDKNVKHFLKNERTKEFISHLQKQAEFSPYGEDSLKQIIHSRGQNGTYMCEPLALKFAAWLDVKFEYWVYSTIQNILFGNYKMHWEAHAKQEKAKAEMERIKPQLFENPTVDLVEAYFENEELEKEAKRKKAKAIKNQLSMMDIKDFSKKDEE